MGTQAFVPWALHSFVSVFGFRFRFAYRLPVFNLVLALLPLLYLISALMVDSFAYWLRRRKQVAEGSLRGVWFLGIFIALTALLVPAAIMQIFLLFIPLAKLPWGLEVLAPDWLSTLFSAPLVLLAGVVAAIGGAAFGNAWFHSKGQ